MSSKFRKNSILAATLIVAASLTAPAFSQQATRELRVPIDSTSLRNTAGPGMMVPLPGPSLSDIRALIKTENSAATCGSVVYYVTPYAVGSFESSPPPTVVSTEDCRGQQLLQPFVRNRARCVSDNSIAGPEGGQIGYNGCPTTAVYIEQVTEYRPSCPSGLYLTSAQNEIENRVRLTCVVPG